ncbi:D-arabinono-1,4-lactone oxidase [Microbacterium sp. A196]|uniref:D-arabinono-1,4-lactone oxidase n=1 Tax=unclassified Microbacterium TaxID=2609290 RepID=UPI003F3FDB11
MTPEASSETWSNWSGSRTVSVSRQERPANETGIAQTVRQAVAEGRQVRAVGPGFSWADTVGEEAVVIHTDRLQGVRSIDLDAGIVSAAGGTRLLDLCADLWDRGLELPTLGGFSGQSIAGALATATHGSGATQAALSAYARAFRIVDAHGEIISVTGDDNAVLRAAQVNLGMLGVVTEVDMSVHAATWMTVRDSWYAEFSSGWLTQQDGVRRAVRWHPRGDGAPEGRRFHLKEWAPARPGAEGALPSYVALASAGATAPAAFTVTEHAAAVDRAGDLVREIDDALRRAPEVEIAMPVALRVVSSDAAYLSPYAGRTSVTVSAAAPSGERFPTLFAMLEEILVVYGARPHWAKEHCRSVEYLSAQYPDFTKFEGVRCGFDPMGRFLTPSQRVLTAHVGGSRRGESI